MGKLDENWRTFFSSLYFQSVLSHYWLSIKLKPLFKSHISDLSNLKLNDITELISLVSCKLTLEAPKLFLLLVIFNSKKRLIECKLFCKLSLSLSETVRLTSFLTQLDKASHLMFTFWMGTWWLEQRCQVSKTLKSALWQS